MKHNFIDLHCHSRFSDGDKNIEQLIELFRHTNTKFAAITDHDDLRSIKKLLKLNVEDIIFIPGVELSTVYYDENGKDYYISEQIVMHKGTHLLSFNFKLTGLIIKKINIIKHP